MKNNNEKQEENKTIKSKPLTFKVSFEALRVYSGDAPTAELESQDIFVQSSVFVDTLFVAIYQLAYEIQSIKENDTDTLDAIRSIEGLALIGRAFAESMREQYYESLGIWGAKADEK